MLAIYILLRSAQWTMAEMKGIRSVLGTGACIQNGGDSLLATDVAKRTRSQVDIAIGQTDVAQSSRAQGDGIALTLALESRLDTQSLLLQDQGIGTRVQLEARSRSSRSRGAHMRPIAIKEVGAEERCGIFVDVVVNDLDDGVLLQLASIGHVGFAGRDQRLFSVWNAQWLKVSRSTGHMDGLLEELGRSWSRSSSTMIADGRYWRGKGWRRIGAHNGSGWRSRSTRW